MDIAFLLERFGQDTRLGKLALDEANTCTFLVDEMKISLTYIAEGAHLLCFAEVGRLPETGGAPLLRAALQANYLFRGTAGATLAVSPDTQALFLNQSLLLDSLSYDDFLKKLSDFVDTLAVWKKLLADYRPAVSDAAAEEMTPDSSQSGFLKI